MAEKVKKPFYKKWWVWLLGVIVVIAVAGNSNGSEQKSTESADKSVEKIEELNKAQEKIDNLKEKVEEKTEKQVEKQEPAKKEGINKAEFEQIQNGMSYEEVVAIIGNEGELQSESEVGNYKTQLYTWKGESGIGSNANVTFQNGKVQAKAQFGLK
ncbi:DUF3862 domain-containing protein [Bacillus cereus group sp. Bc015]|uniref:DUF3862 domain-containing protein n=1 Tax=Bacillus cereus group sp. Bc015 TaxID=3018123 RepID=UPI0022E4D3CE|nr:DUF3862 domain-containing protein [Bacillus cereus group sp. Bc015]MDA2738393.1 DUF3862 domain-containing protein [Bacillus cereus group sp. Bc015]